MRSICTRCSPASEDSEAARTVARNGSGHLRRLESVVEALRTSRPFAAHIDHDACCFAMRDLKFEASTAQ
ncbi:hypothetical protein CC2G_006700 [Coprinopsis cinerea AmutBmut pab1-1]|nr:hypothetical protein CC2G_006700 [Coprinopsis cinerea AmutBmut pab1-1]